MAIQQEYFAAIRRLESDFSEFKDDELIEQVIKAGLWNALRSSSRMIVFNKYRLSANTPIEFGEILRGKASSYSSITGGVVRGADFEFDLRPYMDKINAEDSQSVSVLHLHPNNFAHSNKDFFSLMVNDPLLNLLALGKNGNVYIAIKTHTHKEMSSTEHSKTPEWHFKFLKDNFNEYLRVYWRGDKESFESQTTKKEKERVVHALFHNTFIDFCKFRGLIYFPREYVKYGRI